MTTAPTSAGFDFAALKRAIEGRDAAALTAMYAPDAEVRLADRVNTPGRPRVLRGREEIRAWAEDVAGREMTHHVVMDALDDRGAGFIEECRYPDGTNVLCATVLELRDGAITRQIGVQAWDE